MVARRRLYRSWMGYARRTAQEEAKALRLLLHARGHLPRVAPLQLEELDEQTVKSLGATEYVRAWRRTRATESE